MICFQLFPCNVMHRHHTCTTPAAAPQVQFKEKPSSLKLQFAGLFLFSWCVTSPKPMLLKHIVRSIFTLFFYSFVSIKCAEAQKKILLFLQLSLILTRWCVQIGFLKIS